MIMVAKKMKYTKNFKIKYKFVTSYFLFIILMIVSLHQFFFVNSLFKSGEKEVREGGQSRKVCVSPISPLPFDIAVHSRYVFSVDITLCSFLAWICDDELGP